MTLGPIPLLIIAGVIGSLILCILSMAREIDEANRELSKRLASKIPGKPTDELATMRAKRRSKP